MYRIEYGREASKTMRTLPRNLATTIRGILERLAADPFASNNNVKRLRNREDYRLRIGDWRILYSVNEAVLTIGVLRIGPRGQVYQ